MQVEKQVLVGNYIQQIIALSVVTLKYGWHAGYKQNQKEKEKK